MNGKSCSKLVCLVALIVATVAQSPIQLIGQSSTGSVSGTVHDQTGAVLPGVSIKVANTGTGLTRELLTNERGEFLAPLIPVGTYDVTAEFPGFKTEVRSGVTVQTDQRSTVIIRMQVGEVSERIVVTEDAPLVQSETSSIGNVIDNKKIAELPLNGRAFQNLTLLAPGAMEPAEGSGLGFRGGITVAGAREESTTFALDGVDMVNGLVGMISFKPSIDSIQEFKVQTSTYAAELGQMAGGQIAVTTKAGTNSFHGVAYNFLRNSKLDAKNFFDPANDPIPQFQRNNFGFNLGGPIIRDRSFFFFNAEWLRERRADTKQATVPLPVMLNGDFSAISAAIRDPLTGVAFPGNRIPADRINPAGQALAKLGYPAPNLSGLARNFVSTPKDVHDTNQYTARVDHRFGDKNNIYGRYSYNFDDENDPFNLYGGISNLPFFARLDRQVAQSVSIVDTHVISTRTVLEARLGYNRLSQFRRGPTTTNIPAQAGISGTTTNPGDFDWPGVFVTGYDSLGQTQHPTERSDNTYQAVANLTWSTGSHNIKTGVNIEEFQSNRMNNSQSQGVFRFTGVYSGNGLADMLLGFPSQVSRRLGDTRNPIRHESYGFYVQDDWKVMPRLTLNLGVRYELVTPFTSIQDRMSTYNPATGKMEIAGNANVRRDISRPENTVPEIKAALAGIQFVDLGVKKIYDGDHNNFAPRFGFAYDVFGNGRTSVRGGFGVFYDLMRLNNGISISNNLPYRFTQTCDAGTTPRIDIRNPFSGAGCTASVSPDAIQKDFRTAHIEQWNFSLQHEVVRNMVVDLIYAGSKGNSLWRDDNINQAFPGTVGTVASRRPIQGYGNIVLRGSQGQSVFHSFMSRVEKRFSDGFTFLSSFTWSKSLDDFSGRATSGDSARAQDVRNMRAERAVSAFDATYRWTFSGVYELPFGRGHRWMSDGIGSWIVGGWEVSGIGTFMTGRPLTVVITSDRSGTGNTGNDRPMSLGDAVLPRGERTPDRWFRTDVFALPAAGTFGNLGRNTLRGPGTNNLDISFLKNHRFGENRNVQFRTEIFNFPNHPNFNMPNRQFGTQQFGRIFSARPSRQIQFGLKIVF